MHTIKVRWVVKKENKIFFAYVNKWWFYCLPWWTYEGWETFKECLSREFVEELWITPEIWKCVLIREFKNLSGELYLDIWFEILNIHDFDEINNQSATHAFEISDAKFLQKSYIDNLDVRPKEIFDLLDKNNTYIEFIN